MQADDPLILAIDVGTTSTRAIAFDMAGKPVAGAGQPLAIQHPRPGWVEQDGAAIMLATQTAIAGLLAELGVRTQQLAAVGLTNQRETVLLWDARDGAPVGPALSWQDRRVADRMADMRAAGDEPAIQRETGLVLDPYFSAAKLAWLLGNVAEASALLSAGHLCAGTIDSFIAWHLTDGAHITDVTNASRTMLLALDGADWSAELLARFDIPRTILPRIVASAGELARVRLPGLNRTLPLTGIAGDQQAAAIGQACLSPGMVKSTYGTGCFVVASTGATPLRSQNRLLTSIGYEAAGERHYVLEGSIFTAGSLIQWLRDKLGLIDSAAETEVLARRVKDSAGVVIVPALTGLGAPHWRADARGLITGLTGGASRAHVARAALEAMTHQTDDLLAAFAADGAAVQALRIEGGMAANDWLAQDLADVLDVVVERPASVETTAWGAAMLAAVGAGLAPDLETMAASWRPDARFASQMSADMRAVRRANWRAAVDQCLGKIGQ